MDQILASLSRTIKEYTRNRLSIISTLGIPLFFMIILPNTILDIPQEFIPQVKGFITITMVSLLIMSAGQANLAGFIAADRNRGLYRKLSSMPVIFWKETLGRVLAVWIFSFVCVIVLVIFGISLGAEFTGKIIDLIAIMGFLILIGLSSVGTGLVIASCVKNESIATHLGVGISLVIFFLGGMAIPFSDLPESIQLFAKLHPVSSATASIIYLLIGKEMAGYNPFYLPQMFNTIILSFILFIVGNFVYTEFCCKRS